MKKSKNYSFFVYLFILIFLAFLASHGFYFAGYIIYSSVIFSAIMSLVKRRMPMGISGTEEIWTGTKAVGISLFILFIVIVVGIDYKDFNWSLFVPSLPFGVIFGYFSYKTFTSARAPLA